MVEEDADPATVARMGDRLDAANADASAARTAGEQAYERAEQAARTAAATFSAVAAAAPDPPPPPPPPPPPKEEDDGGFLSGALGVGKDVLGGIGDGAVGGGARGGRRGVADGWEWAGNQGDPWNPHSPAFAVDVIEGAAGAVWGVGELGWQGVKASTYYERFDPEGSAEARQGFADGAEYAWDHPWETTKAVLGINHFENGEPGKFVGEVGITALATLASGGAAAGAKTASGASKVSKVADDVVDAGNAARAADDVSDLQKLGKLDYSDRMAREVPNFAEPRPVADHRRQAAGRAAGQRRRQLARGRRRALACGWWLRLDEARTSGQRRGVPQRLRPAGALDGTAARSRRRTRCSSPASRRARRRRGSRASQGRSSHVARSAAGRRPPDLLPGVRRGLDRVAHVDGRLPGGRGTDGR